MTIRLKTPLRQPIKKQFRCSGGPFSGGYIQLSKWGDLKTTIFSSGDYYGYYHGLLAVNIAEWHDIKKPASTDQSN